MAENAPAPAPASSASLVEAGQELQALLANPETATIGAVLPLLNRLLGELQLGSEMLQILDDSAAAPEALTEQQQQVLGTALSAALPRAGAPRTSL